MDGIRVIRVWSYITANEGFLKRTLDYISFSVTSFFAGLFQQADIIIATSPPIFHSLVGTYPFFLEKKTLDHGSPRSMARIHQNSRCHERKSYNPLSGMGGKRCYRSAQKIVVVTDSFKKRLKRKKEYLSKR